MNRLLILLVFLASCSPSSSTKDKSAHKDIGKAIEIEKQHIDASIVNQIIALYKNEYKNDSIGIEESDSSINIYFYGLREGADDSDESMCLLVAYISKMKSDYLFGDLNGDSVPEIVSSVNTEGGGGGGNAFWNDLFVFTRSGNGYRLLCSSASPAVCGCNDDEERGGNFYPDKIQDGIIAGESVCWDEGDGHCCPSLHFDTKVRVDANKLVFLDKRKRIVKEDKTK